MTTCNVTHATLDELFDCPPCDAFLTDPELYTCGICGWYKTDDEGELSYHRATYHTDY